MNRLSAAWHAVTTARTRRSYTRTHTNEKREPVRVIKVVMAAVIVAAVCALATGAASQNILPLSGIGVGG